MIKGHKPTTSLFTALLADGSLIHYSVDKVVFVSPYRRYSTVNFPILFPDACKSAKTLGNDITGMLTSGIGASTALPEICAWERGPSTMPSTQVLTDGVRMLPTRPPEELVGMPVQYQWVTIFFSTDDERVIAVPLRVHCHRRVKFDLDNPINERGTYQFPILDTEYMVKTMSKYTLIQL